MNDRDEKLLKLRLTAHAAAKTGVLPADAEVVREQLLGSRLTVLAAAKAAAEAGDYGEYDDQKFQLDRIDWALWALASANDADAT